MSPTRAADPDETSEDHLDGAEKVRARQGRQARRDRMRNLRAWRLNPITVGETAEEMVRDEEKHADWFEAQIEAVERVGVQQYLASRSLPARGRDACRWRLELAGQVTVRLAALATGVS